MNENNNLIIVPENVTLVSTSEGFIDQQDNHPNLLIVAMRQYYMGLNNLC